MKTTIATLFSLFTHFGQVQGRKYLTFDTWPFFLQLTLFTGSHKYNMNVPISAIDVTKIKINYIDTQIWYSIAKYISLVYRNFCVLAEKSIQHELYIKLWDTREQNEDMFNQILHKRSNWVLNVEVHSCISWIWQFAQQNFFSAQKQWQY